MDKELTELEIEIDRFLEHHEALRANNYALAAEIERLKSELEEANLQIYLRSYR